MSILFHLYTLTLFYGLSYEKTLSLNSGNWIKGGRVNTEGFPVEMDILPGWYIDHGPGEEVSRTFLW